MARSKPVMPIEPYLADLEHEDYQVRRDTIKQLAKTRNPEAIPYLIKALKDKIVNVRVNAIKALTNFKDPRIVTPLLEQLAHDSCKVHGSAHEALASYGLDAVPTLIPALQAKNKYIRGGAASLLGETQTVEAVEPLIACLADTDPYVLIRICKTLEILADERAITSLWELVEREGASFSQKTTRNAGLIKPQQVKLAALNSLIALGDIKALHRLLDEYVGRFSIELFIHRLIYRIQHGETVAQTMLTVCIEHENLAVRSAAEKISAQYQMS